MKVLCFYPDKTDVRENKRAAPHVGVKLTDGVFDLSAAGYEPDLADTIANFQSLRPRIEELIRTASTPLLDENSLCFAPPAPVAAKIICAGQNYQSHINEMAKGKPPVIENPVLFSVFSDTLSAHGEAVRLIPSSEQYDYEAELVVVMGQGGMNIPKEKALSHVFGYTCGNDLSERSSQMLTSQWMIGKSMPGFSPLGPWIVTSDELEAGGLNPNDLSIQGYRNEELSQDTRSSDMLFDISALICFASRFIELKPGDLIYTGTPSGVIASKADRKWLTPGESFSVKIEGIGTLRTNFV